MLNVARVTEPQTTLAMYKRWVPSCLWTISFTDPGLFKNNNNKKCKQGNNALFIQELKGG